MNNIAFKNRLTSIASKGIKLKGKFMKLISKRLFLFCVVFSGMLSTKVFASSEFYRFCSFCSTDASYESVASVYSQPREFVIVYLMNTETRTIRKYQVYDPNYPVNSGGGRDAPSSNLVITLLETEFQKRQSFNNAVTEYELFTTASDNRFKVPEKVATSVWDLVGAGYIEADVIDYYNNHASAGEHLKKWIKFIADISPLVDHPPLVIEIEFPDGSDGEFKILGMDNDDNLRLEFLRGNDVDNNYVRTTPEAYTSGRYRFEIQGEEGVRRFTEALQRLGVSVSVNGNNGGGGGIVVRTCDFNESTNTLTCTFSVK